MASYTGNELKGQGTPIEALTAGVEYIFTVTTPSTLLGSAYFTFETVRNANGFYDSTTPQNAVGILSSTNIPTLPIQSPYIFSEIISPGGNTFSFTPTNNVAAGSAFLRGTGGISLAIDSSSDPNEFRFSVKTDNVGTSNDNQFTIPINLGTFNYTVTTSDGTSTSGLTGDHTITFPSGGGTYDVVITGTFPGMKFNNGGDKLKILTIDNFGIYGVGSTSQRFQFWGCSNLVVNATDTGDFSQVTNFQRAFRSCSSITTIPSLDFSSATNFTELFYFASNLTTFPANLFDNSPATNYTNAFTNTNLTQQSIDNILVSIDTAGGTNGIFKQSGGSTPSAVGLAARDSLIAKGWEVIITPAFPLTLTSTTKSSNASMDVGTILGIDDLRFNNENEKLIDYTSVTYSWQDASSNVLSTSPRLPLNISDVGKDVSLIINASDYAGNVMTEKVYSFGTVTNTATLTEHFYDKRDDIMFWDFSQEITGDYITPSNTDNPAYSFSDINGKHKMVNVNTSNSYSTVNFDSTENGFLKQSKKLQFPKAIGQRNDFFITFTVRFPSGTADDFILSQYLQTLGVDDTSLFVWHDTSQNRINLGGGGSYRLGGVVDAQWVTYTVMWLDNTPTSTSVIKIIATQGGTALTPITRTSSVLPTLDLQTRTGISASANVKTTFFRSTFVDVKHIILPKMTGTLLTESEITTIHNQAHNAI